MAQLPYELVEYIVQLAANESVSTERHRHDLSGAPGASTHCFLLAASLVSHTWRTIAQAALLHTAVVS